MYVFAFEIAIKYEKGIKNAQFFGFNTFCCHFHFILCWIYRFTFSCLPLSPSHSLFIKFLIHVHFIFSASLDCFITAPPKMNFIWWKMQSQTNDRQTQSDLDLLLFLLLNNRKVLTHENKSLRMAVCCYFYIEYYLYSSDMNESSEWVIKASNLFAQKMWLS